MILPFHILAATWIAVSSLLALQQSTAASGHDVGVRQILAISKERGADLAVTIWYPAASDGEPVMLGESVFFKGTSALKDARVSPEKYPLIVLSHGAGLAGNPQALSWIATPLARHGYIVAAPTHPGNSGANRSALETMKLWLRPGDVSATLDAMETDAVFRDHITPGRTGMLGLSMGGNTALSLAGARLDPQRLADYCDTDALNASLCEWVKMSGVDLHSLDLGSAGRDNRDGRITFVMAIDPAPADVFDPESFADISIPVDLVNLGQAGKIPVTADVSAIAKTVPQARYTTIEDASHFSMFAECRPGAAELTVSENIGDPICADGGGRSRGEIHAQMIDMVVFAFDRVFKPGL
jgi:predicted dienelactone hydrolase